MNPEVDPEYNSYWTNLPPELQEQILLNDPTLFQEARTYNKYYRDLLDPDYRLYMKCTEKATDGEIKNNLITAKNQDFARFQDTKSGLTVITCFKRVAGPRGPKPTKSYVYFWARFSAKIKNTIDGFHSYTLYINTLPSPGSYTSFLNRKDQVEIILNLFYHYDTDNWSNWDLLTMYLVLKERFSHENCNRFGLSFARDAVLKLLDFKYQQYQQNIDDPLTIAKFYVYIFTHVSILISYDEAYNELLLVRVGRVTNIPLRDDYSDVMYELDRDELIDLQNYIEVNYPAIRMIFADPKYNL